jgi:hypothetical protein
MGVDYSWSRVMRCDEGQAHLRVNGGALAWGPRLPAPHRRSRAALRSGAAGLDEEDGLLGDETAPASPAAEAVRLWASGGCGGRGAKPGGAAVAAGAVRRLRNPFLPLIPKARNGAERRGGPFCCCSCFPASQDVVPEQAPRDGHHEVVRMTNAARAPRFRRRPRAALYAHSVYKHRRGI